MVLVGARTTFSSRTNFFFFKKKISNKKFKKKFTNKNFQKTNLKKKNLKKYLTFIFGILRILSE